MKEDIKTNGIVNLDSTMKLEWNDSFPPKINFHYEQFDEIRSAMTVRLSMHSDLQYPAHIMRQLSHNIGEQLFNTGKIVIEEQDDINRGLKIYIARYHPLLKK